MTAWPFVSVVIPTHNRLPQLRECLAALTAQTYPCDLLEVIVVADGCTDGTAQRLPLDRYPFRLHVLSQPRSGAAAARNHGAEEAVGTLLLFIDDDVIASTGLVAAHVRVHGGRTDSVAIGPYRLARPRKDDFYGHILYTFWERTFGEMGGYELLQEPRYVLSGNLSVSRSTFNRAGRFNTSFPASGVEDYEFGIRILEQAIPVVFVADAHARHLDTTTLVQSFRRARQEGSSHTFLARLHPSHAGTLPLARRDFVGQIFVFAAPPLGPWLTIVGDFALRVSEALRLRAVYETLYGGLRRYRYWQGVADAVGDRAALDRLISELTVAERKFAG